MDTIYVRLSRREAGGCEIATLETELHPNYKVDGSNTSYERMNYSVSFFNVKFLRDVLEHSVLSRSQCENDRWGMTDGGSPID